jgi:alpha-L-arabinofuranosidase
VKRVASKLISYTVKILIQNYLGLVIAITLLRASAVHSEPTATVTVQAAASGTRISPDLFGIFFEDINYAADGGLYAELLQNRSFEYSAMDRRDWNALTAWQLVTRGEGKGSVSVKTNTPLNAHNLHYAVVTVEQGGAGVGLANSGFDGVVLKKGDNYDVSFCAWQASGKTTPLTVRLESKTGTLYGEATIPQLSKDWKKYTATIQSTADDADVRLLLLTSDKGTFCFDDVSLFPEKTFHNRPNGMRADLAQSIADLHPKFMRFPGGCLVHGQGLGNIYRWKDTIGPIEQRKGQRDLWSYHQSVGLGYFEYFQFCEDIGAKPLPVLAAGVSCQFAAGGQHGLPMDQMQDYVQDVLDLIEYANGPANSTWGAKRASAGHPAQFNLAYIGVGNEDAQTPEFGIRFKIIYDAVKAKYPKMTVVGTAGPFPDGPDFAEGWKFAKSLNVDIVDEHYYQAPEWFLQNLHRYDNYDRSGPKVYVGEYASKRNSLFNALAEAAYLTSLERNGDVVRMASYAPLLGRENHMQWQPNLIYFNNSTVCPSVNYYVQQLFGQNQGDVYLPTEVSTSQPEGRKIGFLLGLWDTQAQFKDVKIVSGNQTLVEESFAATADNWTAISGRWHVTDGAYAQDDGGQPALSLFKSKIEQSDYTLTLKARKTGGREGFLIGFGEKDTRNYYWWNLGGWDNTQLAVEKTSNGSKTTVGDAVAGSIELNRWYEIKIAIAAGHIKCYLDGVLKQDIVDDGVDGSASVVASCVKDSKTGDIIIKLVNLMAETVSSQVSLVGIGQLRTVVKQTVLTGDLGAENTLQSPTTVVPASAEFKAVENFTSKLPAHSLTILRMKTEGAGLIPGTSPATK